MTSPARSFHLLSAIGGNRATRLFLDRRHAADGSHALPLTGVEGSPDGQVIFGLIELTTRDADDTFDLRAGEGGPAGH